MANVRDGSPPPSEADVTAVERRLGVGLPPDYRAFLLAHDGGEPDPAWFLEPPTLPAAAADWVESFAGCGELASDAEYYRRALGLPPEFLPVGTLGGGGGTLLLRVAGPRRGGVVGWWAKDTGYPGGAVGELAETWADFLTSLRDEAVVRGEMHRRRGHA